MAGRWTVAFYDDRVEAELRAFPAGQLARFVRYVERIELFGPDLGMPHARAMGNGLFELRIRSAEGIARVFYCTVATQRIVFLHQFAKKTDKTPPNDLDVARRRLRAMKNG